ncbi:hypothetical protein [Streptomyces sp. NPDC002553]|uniref:hypothetical protein n=1 Tax=Streptomyces sp. NPDC002553 TaxID=3154417 RepID=UPI0033264504
MSWIRDRFWSHFVVGWVLVTVVLIRWDGSTRLGLHALPMALIASWAWALHWGRDIRVQVAEGFRAQHHTWNSLLRSWPPHDPSPLHREFVQRMGSAEQYLRAMVRAHRLQRLSIAFTDGWHPGCDGNEAASVSEGRRAHLWLGSNWFGPEQTIHLPVILEHELGHVLRRDTQRSTVLQAAGVFLVVLAAAWLPLSTIVPSVVALRLLYVGWVWHSELACDTRAARACGSEMVILLWRRNTGLLCTLSPLARMKYNLRSAFTHPPYWLRIWWTRRVNAPATSAHPLAVLSDAYDLTPPLERPTNPGWPSAASKREPQADCG